MKTFKVILDVNCDICDKNNQAKLFCCKCQKILLSTKEDVTVFQATQKKCQDLPNNLSETNFRDHEFVICSICKDQKYK